ncbi:HYR domain-containing protein [Winogradskyella luteola]|uniref:HYR domain-containing protein n=1 Tax=Winogradskyella luteola TaxID=2828330 RepID=A0A9X1FCK7_9FLAO|nr:HYR domain-containing protein [Winogradskyella luteola]MBV7270513.1 HYR domain-containing protein [Winogradskyella luteola]
MKKKLRFTLLFSLSIAFTFAQGIFDDSIHTAVGFGSVNSPGGEAVQNVIDQNSSTKFLDFNAFDGIGFEVDLLGESKIAVAIEIVTANDAPERDPTDYEIFGSNNGTDYTSIITGNIPCVPDRFFSRTFSFTNTTGYTFYRVNFTGTCASSSINQIADVQLYETIGNAPMITCPSDINVNNDAGTCGALVNYSLSANDDEDGALAPTITSGLASGETFPVGITEVFASVTDSDNNTVSCSFIVTVTDNENPLVSCPSDITQTAANPGDTSAVVNYSLNPTDNCDLINPLTGFTPLANINNKAYYLSDASFSPQDAFTNAVAQGGFVGTIRDGSDNTLLVNAISSIGAAGDVLIGYNDVSTEGSFEWQSGDSATYNNWNAGEPNNAGNEDYTVVQSNAGWNDVANSSTYRYLLEIDYSPTQTAGLPSGSDFPIGTTTNTFEITDISGNSVPCSFNVIVEQNLSLNDNNLDRNISVYPNPTSSSIILQIKTSTSIDTVTITDLNGRILQVFTNIEFIESKKQFDVSQLSLGVYFMAIKSKDGHSALRKFIKR